MGVTRELRAEPGCDTRTFLAACWVQIHDCMGLRPAGGVLMVLPSASFTPGILRADGRVLMCTSMVAVEVLSPPGVPALGAPVVLAAEVELAAW